MVTVLRAAGLRIVIYRYDHEPPHVHVFGDGETKIELGVTPADIGILYAVSVTTSERRRAVRAVRASHGELVEQWNDLHG